MKFTNYEMEQMVGALAKHMERKDVVGYAAARNTRILQTELSEYMGVRNELVMKYGEMDVDEQGNPTGSVSLSPTSENFGKFVEEIERFASLTHQPDIFKIPVEEVVGKLSGTEILEIDWMLEEE